MHAGLGAVLLRPSATVSMRTVASSASLWTAPTGCCERADNNNNNADATSGSSSASEESNISYSS